MTDWVDEMRMFFAAVQEPLSMVLSATGCREGWLQGEAFRFFRSKGVALYTNEITLPSPSGKKNRKADLAVYSGHDADATLLLISEIKVYGERYFFEKNLTGGSLAEVSRRLGADGSPLTFSDCARDRQLVVGSGLLTDYFRLVDFTSSDKPARLLILCVKKDESPDRFGSTLRCVEFEGAGVVICDTKNLWVKCWTVGANP